MRDSRGKKGGIILIVNTFERRETVIVAAQNGGPCELPDRQPLWRLHLRLAIYKLFPCFPFTFHCLFLSHLSISITSKEEVDLRPRHDTQSPFASLKVAQTRKPRQLKHFS